MNSSGPRSANVTGPTPVLAVRESSMRAPPVASVAGQFAALDMAQSIAGEPAISRKSAVAALVNFGSACFECAATADFRLMAGSPAIDCAMSSAANWPATDATGGARMDDSRTANTGVGPVTFADLGPLEFIPPLVDHAPVVTAPG